MTDQDSLRDRIAQVFYQVGNGVLVLSMSPNERNDLAQAIIDEFALTVVYSSRQHAQGSALELDETPEEYTERVRMKTIYKIEGRFSK